MTDRELLQAAAKAAGYTGFRDASDIWSYRIDQSPGVYWNPLTDDGDALRLAVKLGISIDFQTGDDSCTWCQELYEIHGDPYAATRRAITRAAAEMGKE